MIITLWLWSTLSLILSLRINLKMINANDHDHHHHELMIMKTGELNLKWLTQTATSRVIYQLGFDCEYQYKYDYHWPLQILYEVSDRHRTPKRRQSFRRWAWWEWCTSDYNIQQLLQVQVGYTDLLVDRKILIGFPTMSYRVTSRIE